VSELARTGDKENNRSEGKKKKRFGRAVRERKPPPGGGGEKKEEMQAKEGDRRWAETKCDFWQIPQKQRGIKEKKER